MGHRTVVSGKVGAITKRLRNLFFDVVNGRVSAYRHWLTPVYAKEAVSN